MKIRTGPPSNPPNDELNGDLSVRVTVDTSKMPWTPSPSPNVTRKRVHRVGPAESGQVTSVVRYAPGSEFPAHEHPDGEEILVLDGVFSDKRGDWPAGTYLLNPEGFSHAPSSAPGCELFVKLRQFPGVDREQLAIDTNALDWQTGPIDGVEIKPLYDQAGYADRMQLERWPAGCSIADRKFPDGAELFVIDGSFSDEAGHHVAGTWMRFPCGATHTAESAGGCTLYVKLGGHRYLR